MVVDINRHMTWGLRFLIQCVIIVIIVRAIGFLIINISNHIIVVILNVFVYAPGLEGRCCLGRKICNLPLGRHSVCPSMHRTQAR